MRPTTRKIALALMMLVALGLAVSRMVRTMTPAAGPLRSTPTPAARTAPSVAGPADRAPAEVVSVTDGDTVVVRVDGREERVRLVGIDTPELARDGRPAQPHAREATEFVRGLLRGREVRLVADRESDDRDRHGRLLRYLEAGGVGDVGEVILREGHGFVFTRFPFDRRERYVNAEAEARGRGAGLWSADRVPTVDFREAPVHVGAAVVSRGVFVATKDIGRLTFLDFHEDHEGHLAVIVFREDYLRFPGPPAELYRGARVEVLGRVTEHRGRPQIVITSPDQIR